MIRFEGAQRGVVTVAVAVAVEVLTALVREGVLLVRPLVPVSIRASEGAARR